MIEFKADCGHTIRARDEDAGGAVRCSYCGRTVAVPDAVDGGLDYLFRDLPAQQAPEPRKKWPWRRRKVAAPRQAKAGEVNPFGIVVRLCYFALLIIILYVLGNKFVLPMFDSEERARRMAGGVPAGEKPVEEAKTPKIPTESDRGLLKNRSSGSLYVSSVPMGATAFVMEESKAPKSGRIFRLAGVPSIHTNGDFLRLADGTYLVEVALPWNDPGLNDPSLPGYAEYLTFRRSLERSSDAQRRQLQEEYFLPDEASNAFVSETDDQIYFVRQYRGVVVQQGRSKGIRALFLPRLGKNEERAFSLEPLLHGYIPPGARYGFDEKLIRAELTYYEVPPSDQQMVMETLARAGAIPYAGKNGSIRMFKIDIHSGAITTRVLREGGT